jgi:hypothetical protein
MDALQLSPELRIALRARRGTAAAYAAAFGALLLFVVLRPYRRGDVWAWWAILVSLGTLFVLTLLRWPLLGTERGVGSAAMIFGLGIIALLLDLGRVKPADAAPVPKPPAAA